MGNDKNTFLVFFRENGLTAPFSNANSSSRLQLSALCTSHYCDTKLFDSQNENLWALNQNGPDLIRSGLV